LRVVNLCRIKLNFGVILLLIDWPAAIDAAWSSKPNVLQTNLLLATIELLVALFGGRDRCQLGQCLFGVFFAAGIGVIRWARSRLATFAAAFLEALLARLQ
jgi:hypothetical protein